MLIFSRNIKVKKIIGRRGSKMSRPTTPRLASAAMLPLSVCLAKIASTT
jgi:hypothetical protein